MHCKVPDTWEALSCHIGFESLSLTLWSVQEDVGRLSEISQTLYYSREHVQEEVTREFPKFFSINHNPFSKSSSKSHVAHPLNPRDPDLHLPTEATLPLFLTL